MKTTHTKHLLEGLPLSDTDAARLVLEVMEEMPELLPTAAQGKAALMKGLRRVLHAGIESVRAQEQTVTFAHAAEESLARRTAAKRRPSTLRDLRHFIRRLLRVPGLAERPLRAMSAEECQRALEIAFCNSAHSFRKGRAIMHSIFVYGIKQQWCTHNPVASIDSPPVEEKEIRPLSIGECSKLIETARRHDFRDCLPAVSLMLFAGVRPGEVARLHWADVHCEEGTLSISGRNSKTGGARRVELSRPLRRLLHRQRPKAAAGKRICPPQWLKRWQGLRRAAGLCTPRRRWVPDVLRHTYASYHALTHRNLPALQLQLGHRDPRLLYTRYLNTSALRQVDSDSFWQIPAQG